jgi:hypothetical protein
MITAQRSQGASHFFVLRRCCVVMLAPCVTNCLAGVHLAMAEMMPFFEIVSRCSTPAGFTTLVGRCARSCLDCPAAVEVAYAHLCDYVTAALH